MTWHGTRDVSHWYYLCLPSFCWLTGQSHRDLLVGNRCFEVNYLVNFSSCFFSFLSCSRAPRRWSYTLRHSNFPRLSKRKLKFHPKQVNSFSILVYQWDPQNYLESEKGGKMKCTQQSHIQFKPLPRQQTFQHALPQPGCKMYPTGILRTRWNMPAPIQRLCVPPGSTELMPGMSPSVSPFPQAVQRAAMGRQRWEPAQPVPVPSLGNNRDTWTYTVIEKGCTG